MYTGGIDPAFSQRLQSWWCHAQRHREKCPSYGRCSPTLSSEPVFRVDTLECWQVRRRKDNCWKALTIQELCCLGSGFTNRMSLQECYHGLQVDLPEPEDEGGPKRRGGAKGGSVLAQRGEDKQLLELAGRRMQHAER